MKVMEIYASPNFFSMSKWNALTDDLREEGEPSPHITLL